MRRLPDLRVTGGRTTVTQILPVDDERVMVMAGLRMVDALPAYSDEFWS